MFKVHLKNRIAARIFMGHPWIFSNEVEKTEGDPPPGSIVDVFYSDGKFAGRGYFNAQSQIMVRLLTRDKNTQ
jgi:23S rRNA (cytosine1962-C5)-methyltransferase